LLTFFLLAFAFSWAFWVPLALARKGRIQAPFSPAQMQVLGAYGPAIAALIVTAMIGGMNGLRDFIGRLLAWRVRLLWYWLALFLPTAISLLNTALHMMFGGDAPNFAEPPVSRITVPPFLAAFSPWGMVVPFFVHHLFFGSAAAEELGWRGFVLEKLQQRRSAFKASILVGCLWVVWALPFSWTPSTPGAMVVRAILLLLGSIPASILATWIYNRTQGSLLLVILFNNSVKITDLFITPPAASPVCAVISLWIVAVAVLRFGGLAKPLRPPLPEEQGQDTTKSEPKLTTSIPS
jgi:membrane protease YdiL (CAAX protease family)